MDCNDKKRGATSTSAACTSPTDLMVANPESSADGIVGFNFQNLLGTCDNPARTFTGDMIKVDIGTSSGPTFTGGRHDHHHYSLLAESHSTSKFIPGPIETASLQEGLKQFYVIEEEWYQPIEGLNTRQILLEDYYVDLQFGEIQRNGFVAEGIIPVQEIFLNRKNKETPPTRILVTGESGYGKSTLCKKLVQDWTRKPKYMFQFEIVILIRLRSVTSTIEESVVELCNKSMGLKYKQVEVLRYLRQLRRKCLLILDGYDELKEEARQSLNSILGYDNSFDDCFLKLATVLMTSRPQNKLDEDESNLTRIPRIGKIIRSNVSRSFQKFLNLDELSNEAQISFIEKYFMYDPIKAETLKEFIRRTKMRLTRSPLLLNIMCYIHKEGTEFIVDENFWEQYLRLIFKRAVSREAESSSNVSEEVFHDLVNQLGKIFFDHLQRNDLYINEKEMQDAFVDKADFIMSCGLLQKVFSFTSTDSKNFESPHKSFMEYLSGKYLSYAFNQAENEDIVSCFLKTSFMDAHFYDLVVTCTNSLVFKIMILQLYHIIIEVGPNFALVIRVTSDTHDPLPNNQTYSLILNSDSGLLDLVNNFAAIRYRISKEMHRFTRIVKLLNEHAFSLREGGFRFLFYISNDCTDDFCKAIKVSNLKSPIAKLYCLHDIDSPVAVDTTNCKIGHICTAFLSKENANVTCRTDHRLLEDQLEELLFKELEGPFSHLKLAFPKNVTDDKFVKKNQCKLNVRVCEEIHHVYVTPTTVIERSKKAL